MDSILEGIEETQRELIEEIKKLTLEVQKLQTICGRMDSHISFVETTYDKFKYPLDVVKNKVETFFGRAISSATTTDLD
jgi:hypothetical protein